ncbi:WD-repeat protein [Calothrix sp. NIES-4071]|nr:WD-repeat protein [Calothrix sp. NIES-4071]BAZ54741.1 WD-repeat protein [Calothrix sp. NIES-4105]
MSNTQVKTILILAANPTSSSRLRLDKEVREIDEGLRRANKREEFKLEQKWAVRARDFYRAILDYQPTIVHFCGHGAGEDGIVLEDETGQLELITAEALASMFKLFATKGVNCVLLNACYSEVQAEAISQHVNYVIGMNSAVGDKAAITFAVAFYDALLVGEEVEFAYELGCSQMISFLSQQIPVLRKKRSIIPIASQIEIIPPNPYQGLSAFAEEDAAFFFGREILVNSLVQATHKEPLVAVIGPSGSGKSSVVFAGLIPQLRDEGSWLIESFRPGNQPFYQLASALVRQLEPEISETEKLRLVPGLAADIQEGKVTLQQVASRIIEHNSDKRLLLFIDQFEELYTLCQKEEQDSFANTLLTAIHQKSLTLVLTLRADFYGYVLSYRPLRDALQKFTPQLVSSMSREELIAAITQPAQKLEVQLEAQLQERILDDVGLQAGNLPLLEFALTRLWSKQQNRMLAHKAYDEIGGVKKALANHAQQIYSQLSETEQLKAPQVFIQLVRPGEGTEDTRRKATRKEVGEENWGLVTYLAGHTARLVVTGRDNKSGEDTVEVVHEALIREWVTLHKWMNANRQFRAWQERLRRAMYEWQQTQRDEGALLRGTALALAEEYLKQRPLDMSEAEQEFIQASVKLRDRLLKQEEERRKRRIVLTSITSVFFAGFAVFAGYQWRQAEIGQIQALNQSAKANFTANRNSFDTLIDALRAGKRLQQFPLGINDQQVQADILTNLGQSVKWVREQNRLQGHQDAIQSVSFSPNGQMLATASHDNTVKLWRRDGSLLKTLEGHTQQIMSVRFSPDGKTIASGSVDRTVRLWDSNGNIIRVIPAHDDWVMSVSFSPDGKTIATASADNTVKLWRLDGQLLSILKGHQDLVRQVSFSPKGDQIITVSNDKTVKFWSLDGKKLLKTFDKHSGAVISTDLSDDGMIATGSVDGTVKLWDQKGTLLKTLEHSGQVWSVSISRDGQIIVSSSDDGTVRLWARDGRLLDTWLSHEGAIPSVTFSPDGKILATVGNDGIAKLWQVNRSWLTVLVGHQDNALSGKFSLDGKLIASASSDGTVRIWSREGKLLSIRTGHKGKVNTVSFSPDGKTIVSGGDDTTIKLWSLDGQAQRTLGQHKDRVVSVSFSNDGQTIASASADGTAKLWSLDGKEPITLKGHKNRVLSIAISPDKQTIATAGDDKTVKLWSFRGQQLRTLKGHKREIWSVGFSPDGKTIVTASGDKTINLWRSDGTLITTLSRQTATVLDASFSPDGKMIASASSDRTIKLWRSDGTLITTLSGHSDMVHSVSFSHDSKWLVSAGGDKLVLLWDVSDISLKGLLEKGCRQVSDYLKTQANSLKELCN